MRDRKAQNVKRLALFGECRNGDLEWVCRVADVVDLPAGTVLALEGETVREAIVVMEGIASSADVLLGPGAYFGAAELVRGRTAPMTIESLTAVRLLVFGVREFRTLLGRMPSLQQRLVPAEAQPSADRMLRAVS